MSEQRAIIVGHDGQDGTFLRERLTAKGVSWIGMGRNAWLSHNLPRPATKPDIGDQSLVADLVANIKPDHVFYLAAHHASSEEDATELRAEYGGSVRVHVTGWINFLEATLRHSPATRLLYAASSLVFGDCGEPGHPQDEATPWMPVGVYGLTKALGWLAAKEYRERHALFAVAAVLYNHESELRGERFLSRRIADAAVRIAAGDATPLVLGNLSSSVDWGWAPDYVDAMVRMLDLTDPNDYVVATGEKHTVREFVDIAFRCLDLDWSKHVEERSSTLVRRVSGQAGNASRLRQLTGWRPTLTFEQMVRRLVKEVLTREETVRRAGPK